MSTHSLRKNLRRFRPQTTKRQKAFASLRNYAPWVAAICVGAYLPPKVFSAITAVWKTDADSIWANTGNWSGGVIPSNPGDFADFTLAFTANRTVSLAGPPAIQPVVGSVRFNDTTPASILTIAAGDLQLTLKPSSGSSASFEVTRGNTLAITGTSPTASIAIGGANVGLTKVGSGLLSVQAVANYSGATTLNEGVFIASAFANGGTASSIGASTAAATNLVFNGGTLRLVSPSTTALAAIDRGFTIGTSMIDPLQPGATIDNSSANAAAALVIGVGASGNSIIGSTGPGNRTLVLRGTNTGNNELQETLTDFGGTSGFKTTLIKQDIGFWRLNPIILANGTAYNSTAPSTNGLTNYAGEQYTGDTIVQRGTLQLVFPGLPTNPVIVVGQTPAAYVYPANSHVDVIAYTPPTTGTPPTPAVGSMLQLGSVSGSGLPGGGTLDTVGGQVQRTQSGSAPNIIVQYQGTIQDFTGLVVNAGANQITRTLTAGQAVANMPYVYFDNFESAVHKPGGTLRLSADYIVRTNGAVIAPYGGLVNGWTYRDDNWVTSMPVDTLVGLSTTVLVPRGLITAPAGLYKTIDDSNNLPENINPGDNATVAVALNSSAFAPFGAIEGPNLSGAQFPVNTLRFSSSPAAPNPNKQFKISNGGFDDGLPDAGNGPTTLTINTGGLMMTGDSGITQITGGGLSSASGDFRQDFTDPNNPVNIPTGGGTLGHSEIFIIQRSANPLYISSAIYDYQSVQNLQNVLTVGLTKSGTGNIVLFDATSTGTQGAALSTYSGDIYINEGGILVRSDHALGATADDSTTYHDPSETIGVLGQTYMLGPTAVLDFQGVNYTSAEQVNYYLGEIRASIGRSTFGGSINNLNEQVKVALNIGSYLEINGNLTGVGGYAKSGAGQLTVNGAVNITTVSEIPDSGNFDLTAGNSSFNGDISITNGSLNILTGVNSVNGNLAITNGHIITTVTGAAATTLALTKPGAGYNVDLQQSGNLNTTIFGSLLQTAGDGQQVITGLISLNPVTGQPATNGGSIVINGSIDFATSGAPLPFNLVNGFLSQVSTVNPQLIPTTNFYGLATFALAGTTNTLNHNTTFNNGLTLGSAGSAVNLVANGLGVTTFKGAITLANAADTMTLANSSFATAFTQSAGTMTLNGLDFFNAASGAALTLTGGTFAETGTRRSGNGVYGVRTVINGDLVVTNGNTATANLSPTFSGNNKVTGVITINGTSPLPGVVNGTGLTGVNSIVTATLANRQEFAGTFTLNGGQVTVASANALGTGSTSPGSPASPTVTGGVTLAGEKSSLFFQRGVQTATGEDITIGPSSSYISGLAITNYGAGYGSAPSIGVSGGGAQINLVATTNLGSSGTVGSANVTNVGTGYTSLPSFTVNGITSNAMVAAVFGGAIIRGVDQHNVIDGSIILNNTIASSTQGTVGAISLGSPLISVGQDDTLQIKGDIFGVANVTSGVNGTRKITTAIMGGGANNSSSGILILSGQVKDTSSGRATLPVGNGPSNVLNFEIAGSNDLNVFMDKEYVSNGLLQLAQGVLRDTNAASTNFFATGASGVTGNFALSVDNTALGRASVGFNSTVGATINIQTAALFLTQPGQVFNSNISAYLGNSNKIAADGTNTGFIVIGGENTSGTVTIGTGTTGIGNGNTIALSTDTGGALRDLRLLANAGGTVEIKANFAKVGSGFISIDKVGDGTVILDSAGTSSVLDRTYVLGGVLELGAFNANTGIQRLSTNAAAATIFGGGTLRLNTAAATAGATIGQSVLGATVVRNGLSTIQIANNGQTDTFTFGSGVGTVLTRNTGGVLRVSQTGTGTSSVILNDSIPRNAPVPWLAFDNSGGATAALRATHFGLADTTTGQIGNYLGATKQDDLSMFTSNGNFEESGTAGFTGTTPVGVTSLNTVRFNGAITAGRGILTLGSVAVSVNGGIMVSSDTVGDRTITGGTSIAAGSSFTDLIIQNWGNTSAKLTIASPIANVGANLSGLTLAGDGTTVLTNAANNFKGDVYLSGGILQVASAAPLGADTGQPNVAIKSLQMDGGTLQATGDFAWTNRNIVVYGDRSTISIASGKTFTLTGISTGQSAPTLMFSGGINSQSPEVGSAVTGSSIGYGSSLAATPATGASNIFSGDLVINGGGNFVQIRDNTANTIAGQMFIQGGTEFSYEGNNFGFLGNNLSWMDGTTIESGSTIEIRPTVNSTPLTNTIGEWLKFSGAGKAGTGGAIVMNLPTAAANAANALVDHTVSWTGPVTMTGNASVSVGDTAETFASGLVGMLSFDDNLFDGGGFALTKNGAGILRFVNNRIQNLTTINVLSGEVRFEAGLLGTVGSDANKMQSGGGIVSAASVTADYNNYTTGTNNIFVGDGTSTVFGTAPRLSFVDARGIHNTNITLNGSYMFVQSADAPLQATSFAGDITLIGSSAANGLEAVFTNKVNPIVMFGALVGNGGLTKFGNNEIDFVNPNSNFSGELVIARGGASATSPSIGLYDGGRFTAVSSIRLTNDGTLFLDNQNSLDANTGNDNQVASGGRINDSATITMGGSSRLRLLGNNLASTTEAVGALVLRRGSSAIELDPGVDATGALQNVGMSFASYSREAGSVVNFRVLKTGVNFGTDNSSTGTANISIGTLPTASLVGGNGDIDGETVGGDGSTDPQNLKVLIGAFGGVVARNFASLPANTSLPLALNNNDQMFAGRGMLTIETVGGINSLRPLKDTEYLNATIGATMLDQFGTPQPVVNTRVGTYYDFGKFYTNGVLDLTDPQNPIVLVPGNGTQKNVKLTGGFGPSTSSIAETLFATENFFIFDQSDNSKVQDSLYRVTENVSFNSLTFAQHTSELIDKGGNRIIVEIQPDKTLTIGSGMILAAGLGDINLQDPTAGHTSTQASLIRGGTLEFGNQEAIIQNVAAGLNETTGLFSNVRLAGTNTAIGNNNLTLSDLTISSSIHGTKGLTKSGSSGVNLSGVNTYTGDTNVTEGILRLENNKALGGSTLVAVSGTGELRLQRGIAVGDVNNPHALTLRFSSLSQPSQLKAEAGNNAFYGDIQIGATSVAGDRLTTATNIYDISIVNGTGASFTVGGDIYGLNTATGGTTPLDDVQRGRQARIVNFQNAASTGGVLELRGAFHDIQPVGGGSGAVPSLVTSANEEQVLRAAFSGFNNSNIFVYGQWDSAGSILLRQGALRVMPTVTDFFSNTAANSINPYNVQSRTTIGDVLGGETSLTLTTAGQDFNSPSLIVSNATTASNVLIGGENTSGTVKFFAPSASGPQFNNASLRVSEWDRNVRITAAQGGTVEVYGRITDLSLTGGIGGGNGSITKLGLGTVSLKGMDGNTAGYVIGTSGNNDFDKGIAVAAGQLVLDYNVSSSTNSTIDTTAFNQWGSSTVALTLESGKLELLGDSTAAATQTWSTNLTTRAGNSELAVIPTGTGTLTLNLGTAAQGITRATGSTVNFVSPGTAGKINFLSTLNLGGTGAVLAPWATFGTALGTATDFAAADASRTLGPLPAASYTTQSNPASFTAGQIGTEAAAGFSGGSLTSGIKMLRFGAPSVASTVNIGTGFILGNGGTTDEGTILVPTGVNATKTIAGGDLQVNGAKELFLINYGTGGLNITTPVVGTQPIVLSGPGKTIMGANRQTGFVYINDGVLEVSRLNFDQTLTIPVGALGASTSITLPAGTDLTAIRTGMLVTSPNIAGTATINSISGNTIVISIATTATPSGQVTITPPTTGVTGVGFTLTLTSGTAVAPANQAGLAVGEAVVGAGVANGTVITSLNGTTVGLSNALTATSAVTVGLPNGLGLAAAGNGVVIDGGTLRYTGPSVLTDRVFSIGDAGATFDITQAAAVVQVGQFTATGVIAIGGIGTLPSVNTYAGGITKIGAGTLIATGAASNYSGITDIKAGTLQFNNNGTPFGTSTNALDGTIVRANATIRMQGGAADFTTPEWFTYEANSTLDFNPTAANRTINFDGVSNFQGRLNVTYSGTNAGSGTLSFNPNAGYLAGSGNLDKGTVNNGLGGVLILNESSPEWTGGIAVQGGRLIIKSLGSPTGTGTVPLLLGTSGVNDLSTSTSSGFTDARILFQMRDLVDANGATTYSGAFDSFQINANIPQDIVVNRPSSAPIGLPSNQLKQIGVIGTGLSLDQYNLNGNLRLRDDLQFYVEDTFTNVNAGEESVNFNINGHIISEASTSGENYASTFTSTLNITGKPQGSFTGVYNNLYVVVSLNNSNPQFTGNMTFGNVLGVDNFGFPASNPDANQVLRLNNDLALNKNNTVTLLNNVTLQIPGHSVTIGSLIDNNSFSGQTVFSGGTTTGFITSGATAIVENGSAFASTLTVTQTIDSDWRFLIRDGITASGAQAAPLALVKAGPGIVRIINNNFYSGGTTVTDGTLLVRNSGSSGSATGSGPVNVFGATFGGDNVSPVAGTLTISDNGSRPGVLLPANVLPGGQLLGSTLNLNALVFQKTAANIGDSAVFNINSHEEEGQLGRVFVNTLEVDAPVELVLSIDEDKVIFSVGDPVTLDGDFFRLFAGAGGGSFLSIAFNNGGTFTYGGNPVGNGSDIHGFYVDDGGNTTNDAYIFRLSINNSDVRLTAVPEPNVALTLASGVGMLLGLQRFRRRGIRA